MGAGVSATSRPATLWWLRAGNILFGVLFFVSIIFQSKTAYAASMVFFTLGIVCFELRRRLERKAAAGAEGGPAGEPEGGANHQGEEASG